MGIIAPLIKENGRARLRGRMKQYVTALFVMAQLRYFAEGKGNLYLLTIFPYSSENPSHQPSWDGGISILPAAYLAVDMVNNREDVLTGYTLDLINSDGGCDIEDNGRLSFVQRVIAEKGQMPIMGIIGPGCSTSSLAVSSLSSQSSIALINVHLAGTPLLENRAKFPYSLGILGSSYSFVNATVALMRLAKWKRIAVLYDEERLFFLSTYQHLENDLRDHIDDAEIAFTSAVYDTYLPIADIVALDIRVIFVLTGPEFARKLMCLAFHREIYYPRYQWIWIGRTHSEFEKSIDFTYSSTKYSCHYETLQPAINESLFMNYQLRRENNDTTRSKANITYNQYWDLYNDRIRDYNSGQASYKALGPPSANATTERYATLAFDAIWAFALALSKAAEFVNLTSYGLQLGRTNESNIIREILYSHKFEGVSGHINFIDANGYTTRAVEISQFRGDNITLIGFVEEQAFNIQCSPLVLISDRFQREGLQLVHPIVAAIFAIFTLIILLLTVTLHTLSVIYCQHPYIKAQSPKLNQISYIGVYLFATGTFLHTIYKTLDLDVTTYGNICQAIWPWFFSISFTVFFAPICARTWRLYRIFVHYLNPGPFISEPILFLAVGIFTTIDVLLAIVWTIIDPFQGEELEVEFDEGGDFSIRLSCNCQHIAIWYAAVYTLKIFLLLAAVVFSQLTHGIKNAKFSTSLIRVFIYLFALVSTIGLLLYNFLSYQELNIYVDYTILALTCNILLLLSLLLVFLPPVYPLLKEKLHPTMKTGKLYLVHITSHVYLSPRSEPGSQHSTIKSSD